ncbi:MAG: hypothetical protein KF760_20975 [Candidatus Eremiobacteraeota bacterium]|nr:hypothetical protein [Candidatus Eremiobacteraeota bacterium]MCW5872706.1 hypothetical protein [Candidatus Eremiobacteraeota bacterium]
MKLPASKSTVRLFLGTRRSTSLGNWDREREEDHLDLSLWNRALSGLRRSPERIRKV